MSATQRLIEAVEAHMAEHVWDERIPYSTELKMQSAVDALKGEMAAAKEEQAKVESVAWMTDHPMLFLDVEEARSYCNDDEEPTPLYTHPTPAPASGLSVEQVMKVIDREVLTYQSLSETLRAIRKALEDLAENGGANLRTDPPHNT